MEKGRQVGSVHVELACQAMPIDVDAARPILSIRHLKRIGLDCLFVCEPSR